MKWFYQKIAFVWVFVGLAPGAWAGANFGSGNFAFPQNLDNPYGIHASVYNNQDVIDAYNKWTADCITSAGAGGFLRVQRPNDSGLLLNSTVSEGIGYAMVIAVYMNDENLFDNIWKYEQLHLDANGLMNWYIDSTGAAAGTGGATDADEDMAWGLLMAARQWGGNGTLGSSYQSLAVSQINRIYSTEVSGGILIGGDSFAPINPSYFAPAYYREFAAAAAQPGWLTVAANCYTVLNNNLAQGYGNAANGLDSAWCTSAGVSTATNAAPYDYQYDACRTPFRTSEDYLWFGTGASQTYATLTSNFFSGVGAVSIVDGYNLNGTPHAHLPTLTVSQNPGTQSAAFVGPAGVGGQVSRNYQGFVDSAYKDLVGSKLLVGGSYYDESWTVMSLLMMSGNFLDYNLYTTPTPTPTLTAFAPLTIRLNADGPTFVDSAGATWFADQQFGGANNWGFDAGTPGGTTAYSATQAIANTVNNQATLYRTERWGNPLYRFTVPNGYYQVLFKFCENYDTDSHNGGRVFSVAAEGVPVITNLDVFKTVGEHAAYDVPVTVVVTDGELDLAFSSTVDSSQVNAIQVLRLSTPPTPTITATKTITPTNTPTFASPTPTVTGTPPTDTVTPTRTMTPTASSTPSPSVTATASATTTLTPTLTVTLTQTSTATPTQSFTVTPTSSPTQTRTATQTLTPTVTATPTMTRTPVFSPTVTATATFSSTASATATRTPTLTSTPTKTASPTATATASPTATLSATRTSTASPSPTASLTPTNTPTLAPTQTSTPTWTPTPSVTDTPTRTSTPIPSSTFTPTSTPAIQPVASPVIYPNPARGSQPVAIRLPDFAGKATIDLKVFTTAFRKVNALSVLNQSGGADVPLPLSDQTGRPLANGLYYVVVTTPNGRSIEKLLVLR